MRCSPDILKIINFIPLEFQVAIFNFADIHLFVFFPLAKRFSGPFFRGLYRHCKYFNICSCKKYEIQELHLAAVIRATQSFVLSSTSPYNPFGWTFLMVVERQTTVESNSYQGRKEKIGIISPL